MNTQETKDYLLNNLQIKPGDTVYTILKHVSASGMTRWINLYIIRDNQPLRISWHAPQLGVGSYDRKREAVKVGGCGMDMGFALVYDLSWKLFGPDRVNDRDPGYALNQRWMG